MLQADAHIVVGFARIPGAIGLHPDGTTTVKAEDITMRVTRHRLTSRAISFLGFIFILCLPLAVQAADDIAFQARFDGTEQRYVQVLPDGFDPRQPVDVLVALHGHGSDRWQFIRQHRDECRAVRDVASARGMILVSPDYRARTSWMGPAAEADTLQMITRIKEQFRVRRVILCGASMGGASCLTFSALHPDAIDGVVSMNGTANLVEYTNFQDAIAESFGGTKAEVSHEFRKRSAELWGHRLTMPSAFTVGGKDRSVPPDSVLRLANQLNLDGRRTLLIHRENGGHSTTYDDAAEALRFVLDQPEGSGDSIVGSKGNTRQPDLRLTLPRAFYAVTGTEISIYFDNIVLTETPQDFRFNVRCDIGRVEKSRWTVIPKAGDEGTHPIEITVNDSSGKERAQGDVMLHVVPAGAGEDRTVRLLIVGDSLTHATAYPNELASRLSLDGNPDWTMLGTHRPASAAEGVHHEGYGGWTWGRFVTKYEPNPDGTHRKRSSPFVFAGPDGKPQLNLPRYFETSTQGQQPDIVFFLLGINDCFSADPDDPASIDSRIDAMLGHAETLLAAFRKAAPHSDLAICVTTPPNARESGFEANYKGRYHRWGWKRIQHRLVERLTKHFAGLPRKKGSRIGGVYVVPTHLNLDPIDGYPDNNGVHPNGFGYQQIGTSLYCWLKWRLSQDG